MIGGQPYKQIAVADGHLGRLGRDSDTDAATKSGVPVMDTCHSRSGNGSRTAAAL